VPLYQRYLGFHGFGQAKFANGCPIVGSSHFTLLPQLPLKMMLNLKVVRIDLKILLHYSKFAKNMQNKIK